MTYYINAHVTEFDGAPLQSEACVPASLANGISAQSGGLYHPTAGGVHKLVSKEEESNPGPGWNLVDANKAMDEVHIPFTPHTGWAGLEAAHNAGHYLIVQGDADRFANSTCSGVFNGDHCIGVHPNEKVVDGVEYWWINDPVCKTGRWEKKATVHVYAQKLNASILWGQFDTKVPTVAAPKPPAVTLRYGGKAAHGRKRIAVPSGRKANVRTRPTTSAGLAPTRSGGALNGGNHFLPNRTIVEFFQVTHTGQLLAGSRVWYGDRTGTRWLHTSAF